MVRLIFTSCHLHPWGLLIVVLSALRPFIAAICIDMLRTKNVQALASVGLSRRLRGLACESSLLLSTLDVSAGEQQGSLTRGVGYTDRVKRIRYPTAFHGHRVPLKCNFGAQRPAMFQMSYSIRECDGHMRKNSFFRISQAYPPAVRGYELLTPLARHLKFSPEFIRTAAVSYRANATNRRAGGSKSRELEKEEEDEEEEDEEESARKGPTKTVKIFCAKCQALIYRWAMEDGQRCGDERTLGVRGSSMTGRGRRVRHSVISNSSIAVQQSRQEASRAAGSALLVSPEEGCVVCRCTKGLRHWNLLAVVSQPETLSGILNLTSLQYTLFHLAYNRTNCINEAFHC